MTDTLLRALVDLRDRQVQKTRIQFSNRLSALDRLDDDPSTSSQYETVERWLEVFNSLEKKLDKDIAKEVKHSPIFEELVKIKGIGPMLAAKIIAMIDIEKAKTVSSLWRYCGYAVIDGERERPIKGERLHYNKRLKSSLYVIAGSFLKSDSPYRKIYDSSKARYEATKPEWTKLHIHLASMRKMIKMFLSHLWERWRIAEGLSTRLAYVHNHLGHETIYTPQEFGWS